MKGAAISIIGLEESTKKELNSLGAKNIEAGMGYCIFDIKDYKHLAKIAYMSKTASRVILFLDKIKIEKDIDDDTLKDSLKNIDLKKYIKEDSTFMVQCKRIGNHDFKSTEFEKELGSEILSKVNAKVKLENPDVTIYAHIIDEIALIGIDFCGFNLSKRDYHIFTSKTAIRGHLAASLLMIADIKKNNTILDPLCCSGTIVIEAGLMSKNKSAHMYRKDSFVFNKLPFITKIDLDEFDNDAKDLNLNIIGYDTLLANTKSTQKNAKIANINKEIKCGRADFEWLETKIDEKSIDFIITKLPSPSRLLSEAEMAKKYKELFYQSEFILKDKGVMIILSINDKLLIEVANNNKFKNIKSYGIMIGKQPAKITVFEKGVK